MEILIIGLGSMGLKHAKNVVSLGHSVIGVDTIKKARDSFEEEFKVKSYKDIESALKEHPTV